MSEHSDKYRFLKKEDFIQMKPGTLLKYDSDSWHFTSDLKGNIKKRNISNKHVIFLRYEGVLLKQQSSCWHDYKLHLLMDGKIVTHFFASLGGNMKFLLFA